MSKKCGRCEKTVYPTEEFRCLDKTWHKGCFKCNECGMTLNMKNYKGYNKFPYCSAHYPTLKSTAVADTPEMSRLAQNTKLQSNVKYHEEFEKQIKGTKVSVTDEPELNRLKKNQQITSQIEYTGVRNKNAEMEMRRELGAGDNRPQVPLSQVYKDSPNSGKSVGHSTAYNSQGKVEQSASRRQPGSIADYDPMADNWGSITGSGGGYKQSNAPGGGPGSRQEWEETYPAAQPQQPPPQQQPAAPGGHQPVPMVPVNQPLNLQVHQPHKQQQHAAPPLPQSPQTQEPASQPQYYPPPQQPAAPAPPKGPIYRAMYDYEAQDEDEVGFLDGDVIIDTEPIDEGWMFGTVQRTGKRGMLPANYVEMDK